MIPNVNQGDAARERAGTIQQKVRVHACAWATGVITTAAVAATMALEFTKPIFDDPTVSDSVKGMVAAVNAAAALALGGAFGYAAYVIGSGGCSEAPVSDAVLQRVAEN